jgi:hypothetical protein
VDQLGVKPECAIQLVGDFEPGFLEELRQRQVNPTQSRPREKRDLVLFAAKQTSDLLKIGKLVPALKPEGALWIVYPKGVAVTREIEVLEAGRAAGLTDLKVARFSGAGDPIRYKPPAGGKPAAAWSQSQEGGSGRRGVVLRNQCKPAAAF